MVGYAELNAAMALGWARCHVLVIDAGSPRNRFAPHAHNSLLHNSDALADLVAQACQLLATYPPRSCSPPRPRQ